MIAQHSTSEKVDSSNAQVSGKTEKPPLFFLNLSTFFHLFHSL
ncbi:hypothetical protein [Helicobacter canis]|nr:hypothetical protein [Helicobacter canis]